LINCPLFKVVCVYVCQKSLQFKYFCESRVEWIYSPIVTLNHFVNINISKSFLSLEQVDV